MPVLFREKLAKRAKKAGISVPDALVSPLQAYFELLAKWNLKVSLTALPVGETGDEAVDRLLIEPLIAAKYVPDAARALVDIGSGGGSPAIPLKIARPELSLRMVESKTRKAAFLREAVRHLQLANTAVEAARLETLLIRPELHESADVISMRAVRPDSSTLMAFQALAKPDGRVLLFRSSTQRLNVPLLPFVVEGIHPLLPAAHSELVILKKELPMFHVEQKS